MKKPTPKQRTGVLMLHAVSHRWLMRPERKVQCQSPMADVALNVLTQEAMSSFSVVLGTTFVMLNVITLSNSQDIAELDLETTLDCHRRSYTHKVTQSDSEGRVCWDMVTVMSCWGRCDSNEISDWRFPYKRSHHPVCLHGDREPKTVILSNCEDGADPGTEVHEYMEALSCECSLCKSSEANCEGIRYRGEKDLLSFQSD